VPIALTVRAGNETTGTGRASQFTLARLPAGEVLGELVGEEPGTWRTFPLGRVLSSTLVPSEPVELDFLWDGPLGMTTGDTLEADLPPDDPLAGLEISLCHKREELVADLSPLGILCPSPDSCKKVSCDPNVANGRDCCLDFNGGCADGHRYDACLLRFVQYIGST